MKTRNKIESSSSSSFSSPSSSLTSCKVCNRNNHNNEGGTCPFWTWHPYANEESTLAFSASTKGIEYQDKYPRNFKYLDIEDFDGNVYSNAPESMKAPKPSSSKSGFGGPGNPHTKGPFKGNLPDDLRNVALSSNLHSYLSSNNIIIPLTDNLFLLYISLSGKGGNKGK
jgi:hypothetical protein